MYGLWILPVILIFLLNMTEPITFQAKIDDRCIFNLQSILFSVTFIPKTKSKDSKSENSTAKTPPQNLIPVAKALMKMQQKLIFFDFGWTCEPSVECPAFFGVYYAIVCPFLALMNHLFDDFCYFHLPKGKSENSLYLSFCMDIFSAVFITLYFLFESVKAEYKKGKKHADSFT